MFLNGTGTTVVGVKYFLMIRVPYLCQKVHMNTSVVDRHLVASDPGPTFRFDTDLDPDPTPSFTYVQKS